MILTQQQFNNLQWLSENGADDITSVIYTHKQRAVEVEKLVSLRGGGHKHGSAFIVVLSQSRTINGNYHNDWSFHTYYDNLPEAAEAFNTLCETSLKEKAEYQDMQ